MALTQTVTIINNSGKIISTGKHLAGIFKEAKASYQEKKAAIKADREVLKRAQTFDTSRDLPPEAFDRRYSHDDGRSVASSRRSHRSRRSQSSHRDVEYYPRSRPALTENNLKTHSEVSSFTPSRAPPSAYRAPYAETAPRDVALSRPTLPHYTTAPSCSDSLADSATIRGSMVPRTMSAPVIPKGRKEKEIDMDLAYGNIPPDLKDRTDLDPLTKEKEAKTLISRVEGLLDEAKCAHHSATATIAHLQGNPDAAAAVALTLAELSTLLKQMSPAFLSVIKGGSPAVFALLASPQFLIAAGASIGLTVVMFGGWKIVKQIKDAQAQKQAAIANAMAFEAQPAPQAIEYAQHDQYDQYDQYDPYQQPREGSVREGSVREGSVAYDEAYVLDPRLDEELSSIESWRRGIAPAGDDESVDMELISPEAARSMLGDDTRTERSFRTQRSSKTHRSSRTERTERSERSHHSSRSHRSIRESEVPERKSSVARSEAARSERDAESVASSHRSHRSSASKRSTRAPTLAIEDGSRQKEDEAIEAVLRPKKNNMLKSLFKKKEKEHRDRDERVSALVF
ncbi:hypothetical protein CABS01_15206 [Colletotrichum abscissum]|uniref:Uncharacterized protein n=1 Tax=Colletotrichum abscissum TaxID=1671311 RepID=A0A9Q0B285_9PEZI|nr:uncharacterized protein CABS01_15206 [Colletotrichum abscissum]KAI3542374.1 hypothetical protein CABS02_10437 [Colletotrichum abscissum]KAK1476922.1 hypothetical protein CABS01_15206 [Colletotrichum abscissum]